MEQCRPVIQDGLFGADGKTPMLSKGKGITSVSSCAFSRLVKD